MANFYIINWGNDFIDNYNYGAEIHFQLDQSVSFSSPFMPSGTKIKSWHSQSHFHRSRKSATLPILEVGCQYTFDLDIPDYVVGSMQVIIEFYDSRENHIATLYIDSVSGEFIVPDDARAYSIHLVNKKHQQFTFKNLYLYESKIEKQFDISEKNSAIYSFKSNLPNKLQIVLLKSRKDLNHLEVKQADSQIFLLLEGASSYFLEIVLNLYNVLLEVSTIQEIEFIAGQNYARIDSEYKLIPEIIRRLFNKKAIIDSTVKDFRLGDYANLIEQYTQLIYQANKD